MGRWTGWLLPLQLLCVLRHCAVVAAAAAAVRHRVPHMAKMYLF